MRYDFLLISCLTFIFFASASAQTNNRSNQELNLKHQAGTDHRPKIGLVMSGGGAKGYAHVGVLKVLEDIGIPIDYIGGTSAGALVGGLYASGYNAHQIEEMVTTMDWESLMSDNVNRDFIPFFEKEEIHRYNLSFPIYKRRIDLPNSFLQGQNIQMLFSNKTLRHHNVHDFSRLPIPFLCIAADLERNEEIVMKGGFLPQAMRASMAVPAAIGTVSVDGRNLVDGGVINNYPVDRVIEMGADIIIGVDLNANEKEDSVESVGTIVAQLVNYLGHEKYEANLKRTDIYIEPKTGGYSASEFSNKRAMELITVGVEAAEKVRAQLENLMDSLNLEKRVPLHYEEVKLTDRFYIEDIQVRGVSRLHLDYLKGKLDFDNNQWVEFGQITEGLERIYAGLNYKTVNYRLTGQNKKTLTLYLKESITRTLNLGAHYDRENSAALLMNSTLRNITGPGSLLSADLILSQLTGGRLRYTLDRGARPGLEVNFDSRKLNFDFEDEETLFGNISGAISRLQMNAHSVFYHSFTVGLGVSMEFFDVDTRIYFQDPGNPLLGLEDNSFFNYQAFLKLDKRDDVYYPKKGSSLLVNFKVITDDFYQFQESNPILVSLIKYKHATSPGSRLTFMPGFYLRMVHGIDDVPPYYITQLGGEDWVDYYDSQIPFYGLKLADLQTTNAIVGRLETRYRLFENQYIHGYANVGIMNNDRRFWDDYGTYIVGGGLGYSINSSFGPVSIKFLSSNYRSSTYTDISLGFWF